MKNAVNGHYWVHIRLKYEMFLNLCRLICYKNSFLIARTFNDRQQLHYIYKRKITKANILVHYQLTETQKFFKNTT